MHMYSAQQRVITYIHIYVIYVIYNELYEYKDTEGEISYCYDYCYTL